MSRPSVGAAAGVQWTPGGRTAGCGRPGSNRAALRGSAALGDLGGRYWVRTSDLFGVNNRAALRGSAAPGDLGGRYRVRTSDLFGANNRAALRGSAALGDLGGRYWVRTSDLFGVNEARYHCANRPEIGGQVIAALPRGPGTVTPKRPCRI